MIWSLNIGIFLYFGAWNFTIILTDCQTGRRQQVKAQYLVGADGAHSSARKQLGIEVTSKNGTLQHLINVHFFYERVINLRMMWPQEGAIRIKIKFRGFLTQCTATNTQDAYFLRIRQMTDKSGGTFNKVPQRIMLTQNFGGVSDRFRMFCGGSATNSRLRKGDKTQPNNLNHHMEEK